MKPCGTPYSLARSCYLNVLTDNTKIISKWIELKVPGENLTNYSNASYISDPYTAEFVKKKL